MIAGEDAVNVIQQKTAVAPIIEVRDRNNLPVAGATVVFTINGSGATFAGAQTLTVVTNAAGQATAAGITPAAAGTINISAAATFQGQTATVAIAQSNVMTAAEAAKLANTGVSGGGLSAGKLIAIVGGVGAIGGGAAVAASGSKDNSGSMTSGSGSRSTPTSTTTGPTTPTGTTPTTPTPTTPAPVSNSAPVINVATATPPVGLVSSTPIAFDVQATDANNDQLEYFWEFPDGTTSKERAFSRVLLLGGVNNIRVTVRDGSTSTSRELTVTMKTLTGAWVPAVATAGLVSEGVLTQNGNAIAASYNYRSLFGAGSPDLRCPASGSIRGTLIVIDLPRCENGTGINRYIHPQERFELQASADIDVVSGSLWVLDWRTGETRTGVATLTRKR